MGARTWRGGVAGLCLALPLAPAGCRGGEPGLAELLPPRPGVNVVVVSFDALRADALGVYGRPLDVSPNIDRFASRAVVFEAAYTASPTTPTSFAAAFTGMLPTRVFKDYRLREGPTLAGLFADHGYATAAILNNAQLSPTRDFQQGFDHYDFQLSVRDREILERAIAWLRAHREEPFFLWVHFLSPHAPYDYREEAAHLYDPEYEGTFARTSQARFEARDEAEAAQLRRLYDGEVYFLDGIFGRLVDALEQDGLLARSLVVLTADHGEEFLEHGAFQHERLYEETIRIPLIIRHPLGRGARSRAPVVNVDLLPTLADLAGLPFDGAIDGVSLVRPEGGRDHVLAVGYTGGYRGLALRVGSLKVIVNLRPTRSVELYDLAEDPGETDDLAPRRVRLTAALAAKAREMVGGERALEMGRYTDFRQGLDEATVQALEALGYVEE